MASNDTFKVEFLLAYDDNTWTTEVFELPPQFDSCFVDDDQLVRWWQDEHGKRACYRKVVMSAMYCRNPEGNGLDEEVEDGE